MFKNSAFWQKKVRDFSFNSGVYLMCELEASNNTECSNKIETLQSRLQKPPFGGPFFCCFMWILPLTAGMNILMPLVERPIFCHSSHIHVIWKCSYLIPKTNKGFIFDLTFIWEFGVGEWTQQEPSLALDLTMTYTIPF